MEIAVLEWNINQRGGKGAGHIPEFVEEEIAGADIAVLTEFCTRCEGRDAFISHMTSKGYRCAVSGNTGGNDILIAAKACFPILNWPCPWEPCYGVDKIPENLRVDLDCGGQVLSVVGLRIKAQVTNGLRQEEFRWALNRIKDIPNPILLTGDFNNNRRGSENLDWSTDILRKLLENQGFYLYTPEGGSIYEEYPQDSEFPYDHFAVKGAEVSDFFYDRDFTRYVPEKYIWGRDFREPCFPGVNYMKLASVKPPFPDHAILKGTLKL